MFVLGRNIKKTSFFGGTKGNGGKGRMDGRKERKRKRKGKERKEETRGRLMQLCN